jgi:hypothetical protein
MSLDSLHHVAMRRTHDILRKMGLMEEPHGPDQ